MITDGWIDWAFRMDGPANKVYAEKNSGVLGIALHSAEGSYAGLLRELFKPERQASWMFSNRVDGVFVQHYPVTASCWASGNAKANTTLWSVESEGEAGEPLNEAQVANMLRLAKEWEAYATEKAARFQTIHCKATRSVEEGRTLWEHNECAQWATPNAGPTACPSGRYEPFYAALEETMPDPALLARIERLERLVAGNGWKLPNGQLVTGEEAMVLADTDGGSLFLGLGDIQGRFLEHEEDHRFDSISIPVADHTHEPGRVVRPPA